MSLTNAMLIMPKYKCTTYYFPGIPSPLAATVLRGNTATFLLNSLRSSGVIVFSGLAFLPLPAELPGAGKFCFLSIASTTRWNLRKRASALIKVDSRSIVLDNSFTCKC